MPEIFTSHTALDTTHDVRTHIEIVRNGKEGKETIWYCGMFSHADTIDEAKDLGYLSETELLATLTDVVSKLSSGEGAKVVQVATQIVTIELVPEAVAFKESMRHSGLAKLTDAEREALGLTSLAVYDKVKFHGNS